jgi:hypothetical protein
MHTELRLQDPEELAKKFHVCVQDLIDGNMQARRMDRSAAIAMLREYFAGGIRASLDSLKRIEAGDVQFATLDERDKSIVFSQELLVIERARLIALEHLARQPA